MTRRLRHLTHSPSSMSIPTAYPVHLLRTRRSGILCSGILWYTVLGVPYTVLSSACVLYTVLYSAVECVFARTKPTFGMPRKKICHKDLDILISEGVTYWRLERGPGVSWHTYACMHPNECQDNPITQGPSIRFFRMQNSV